MLSSIIKKIKILSAQKKPFKFLLARLLAFSGLSKHISFRRNGYRLRLFPTALSQEFWLHPESHLADEIFLNDFLSPGDTVVDAGANIGSMTLASSRLAGKSGRVYSVEAHPAIFGFLEQNVRLNGAGNVELYNCALGDRNGEISFSDLKWDNENFIAREGAGIKVRLRRLDDLGIGAGRINLLKIDVEGYEKFVLAGAAETLKRTDCVYFEYYGKNYERYGCGFGDVFGLLKDAGFAVYRLDGGRAYELNAGYSSDSCENLLAVRDKNALKKYL